MATCPAFSLSGTTIRLAWSLDNTVAWSRSQSLRCSMADFVRRHPVLTACVAAWLALLFRARSGVDFIAESAAVAVFGSAVLVPLLLGYLSVVAPRIRDARLRAAGYTPPILWSANWGSVRRPLVTSRLIAQRSQLPPFVLWYAQGAQDGGKWPGEWRWLSAMDGNSSRALTGVPPSNCLQMMWKGERELSLYTISPEAARDLRSGPYGVRKIAATDMEGRSRILTITAGTPGGVMPQAPRPIETRTTQGSSRAGTGDADAERA